jgi:hypothetical protein
LQRKLLSEALGEQAAQIVGLSEVTSWTAVSDRRADPSLGQRLAARCRAALVYEPDLDVDKYATEIASLFDLATRPEADR